MAFFDYLPELITLVVASTIEALFIRRMCGAGWKRAVLASLTVNVFTSMYWLSVVPEPLANLMSLVWGLGGLSLKILVEWVLLVPLVPGGWTRLLRADAARPSSLPATGH